MRVQHIAMYVAQERQRAVQEYADERLAQELQAKWDALPPVKEVKQPSLATPQRRLKRKASGDACASGSGNGQGPSSSKRIKSGNQPRE